MGKTQKEICVLLQNHPQPALAETEPGAETARFYGHLMQVRK
jgi:hypothetical protein